MKLLIVKAGVAGGVLLAGFFQMPATPPMKLGMWESTSVSKMDMPGMSMPNMGGRAIKARSCYTADSWQKILNQQNGSGDCVASNQKFTGSTYSADVTCRGGVSKAHTEIVLSPGRDSMHGTTHVESNTNGHSMTLNVTSDAKYLGADCGSVQPGKPQILP